MPQDWLRTVVQQHYGMLDQCIMCSCCSTSELSSLHRIKRLSHRNKHFRSDRRVTVYSQRISLDQDQHYGIILKRFCLIKKACQIES